MKKKRRKEKSLVGVRTIRKRNVLIFQEKKKGKKKPETMTEN